MLKLEALVKPNTIFGTYDALCAYEILHTVGKLYCPFSGF